MKIKKNNHGKYVKHFWSNQHYFFKKKNNFFWYLKLFELQRRTPCITILNIFGLHLVFLTRMYIKSKKIERRKFRIDKLIFAFKLKIYIRIMLRLAEWMTDGVSWDLLSSVAVPRDGHSCIIYLKCEPSRHIYHSTFSSSAFRFISYFLEFSNHWVVFWHFISILLGNHSGFSFDNDKSIKKAMQLVSLLCGWQKAINIAYDSFAFNLNKDFQA